MNILATTLTTLCFFSTLPLLPSLGITQSSHAALLLSLYHLPSVVLHPVLLRLPHPSTRPFKACVTSALAAFLLSLRLRPLLPFAYLLLGVANAGLQTAAAMSEPPDTLSLIDLLGTLTASLAPLLYLLHGHPSLVFLTLLVVSFVVLVVHPRESVEQAEPLLEKEMPILAPWSLLSLKTARPLSIMLFSTASLTVLHPVLATIPAPLPLSLLALSAFAEPLSTSLLPFGASRVTLLGTAAMALGTFLLGWSIDVGVLLLGAGASAAAVVSVVDVAESANVVFDDVRSPVALLAGVMFGLGHVFGCLIGGLRNFLEVWQYASLVIVVVPLLAGFVRWCKGYVKNLVRGER